ncbi:MAG: dihydrodipicolinate synthase family protein [Bacteroidetes bacterium]|nr:dihydrodipicolinate synthase family protein [Bacteroidota bacterium]
MSQDPSFSVLTASLTPLDHNLNIDCDHLASHAQWLLSQGASGIVLLGTTGEANSFNISERKRALEAVVHSGIRPDKLIVGTGCSALTDTLNLTKHALDIGICRVLVMPPFYYKNVSEDGLYASYDYLLQHVGNSEIRLYLYHFPKMSAIPITSVLVERLLRSYPDQIAGFKDSSGDWTNISMMVQQFPGLQVFAGSEQFLLDTIRAGGAGCISATANVTSRLAAEVLSKWNAPEAEALQRHLYQIRKAVERWPMIAALKALLQDLTGHPHWKNLRPPLKALNVTDAHRCIHSYKGLLESRQTSNDQ